MNGMVSLVLYFPRYMMITGITVLALAFCMPELRAMRTAGDFEKLLPIVLTTSVPVGVVGLMLAGLLAAFMSNFAATINAAPAYLVNDIYKRFINPNSSGKTDVWMSLPQSSPRSRRIVGLAVGLNSRHLAQWSITASTAATSWPTCSNGIWWRFNGYGYFWGMMAGIWRDVHPRVHAANRPQGFSPTVSAVVVSNPIYPSRCCWCSP